MAASGAVLAAAHEAMAAAVGAGVTTAQLDAIAEQTIRDARAVPAFLGYHGFPATICPSVNDQVVHAIPGDYVLVDGDLISIDCGAVLDGWVSDAARTYVVGTGNIEAIRLSEVTRRALAAGIAAATVGNHVGDIGSAVQSVVEAAVEAVGFACGAGTRARRICNPRSRRFTHAERQRLHRRLAPRLVAMRATSLRRTSTGTDEHVIMRAAVLGREILRAAQRRN